MARRRGQPRRPGPAQLCGSALSITFGPLRSHGAGATADAPDDEHIEDDERPWTAADSYERGLDILAQLYSRR